MPSSTMLLTSVSYSAKKNRVKVLFGNSEEKTARLFPFVPEIRMPLNKAVDAISRDIVSPQTGLAFSEGAGKCTLRSPSFQSLKKAHAILSLSLNAGIPLLEPERQFLLSREWSYFERFELEQGVVRKKQSLALSQLDLPGKITLREALLSRMLALPPDQLPVLAVEKGRVLLENAAFKSAQFIYGERDKHESFSPGGIFNGFVELDFSRALLKKVVDFNIGFGLLNCDCCKPSGIDDGNVLPNSMVEVEFLESGFFFESLLPSFASFFNENNKGRESRKARKREFSLEQFPVGPFYSGQKAFVPLADARKLEAEGNARLTGRNKLKWSCRREQSFLACKARELLSMDSSARKSLLELEKKELKEKGLNAFNPCFVNPKKRTLEEVSSVSQELIKAVFSALLVHNSNFRHNGICEALEAFKGVMLEEYNRQLLKMKSEPIYSYSGREFIRSMEDFTDLALASREIGIPVPSFH